MTDHETTQRRGALPLALVAVGVVTAAAHWPALSSTVISLDDTQYLTNNHLVKKPSWTSAKRFLTEVRDPSTVGGYYQPLSMISLMVDYALWGDGDDPRAFHRTSLALHAFNAMLIAALVYSLVANVWISAAGGMLFGVHSMTVETIPWVGERKTVLATFFALWSLVLYVRHAKGGQGWSVWLWGSLVMYVLAVMSKPTTTPLPVCMLFLDWGVLGRFGKRAILEKAGFFVVAGVSAGITVNSQGQTAALTASHDYSIFQLAELVCYTVAFYFYKMVWPVGLTAIYPFPDPVSLSNPAILAGVVGFGSAVAGLIVSLRWTRSPATGLGFFFVALLPTLMVIGYSLGVAADKYAYLPAVGIVWMLSAGAAGIWRRAGRGGRGALSAVLGIAIVLGTVGTREYLKQWSDTETYFKYLLTRAPESEFVHNHLGFWLVEQGRVTEGAEHLRKALAIDPGFALAHHNLGFALDRSGKYAEAMTHYEAAIRAVPAMDASLANLGAVLIRQGKLDAAVERLTEAIELNPDSVDGHANMGAALYSQGKLGEAKTHCETAIRIDPRSPLARTNLGAVLLAQGEIAAAVEQFAEAVRLDPRDPAAHGNLGIALLNSGELEGAAKEFFEALRIDAKNAPWHHDLGMVLEKLDRMEDAIEHYEEAVKLDPGFEAAKKRLAALRAKAAGAE